MSHSPVVAVIHATAASMEPVKAAFAETSPDVELWHLLDDRLVREANEAGGLTDELHGRMASLIDYALTTGADAVQLACSMYGPVAAAKDGDVPVVAADQAMFDRVVGLAPATVGVLATASSSADDTVARLGTVLRSGGLHSSVTSVVVDDAARATAAGDRDGALRALAEAAVSLAPTVDVVVLAQYSMSPALDAITVAMQQARITVPVLSPAHLAADKVSGLVNGAGGEVGDQP
ncbi:aspartate/glutamate racemase [Nocardioides cavernae]|uniref:Aspartate/glutamate racemase n=1 Tax=Nocardioides cavernae TaxID=1921566 RepID=A0A7Y9H057_9ACTN|nr:hypothetical protein [Nocardioides cavernae]NYE35370.1 aspartate/glutamate racemase [Nocardioides cavernae]